MGEPRRVLGADLARFTTAGFGTVHGAVDDLAVGDLVLVADEDSDTLPAEVVATRPGAVDLRVRWDDRPPAPEEAAAVHVELGPVERDLGVTEIGDVDLDAGQQLRTGDRLVLIDEGGYRYPAEVERVEPGRYGNRYRVRFTP